MAQAPVALQVSTLPQTPGVYQYYDKDGQLLYIGKAKNLKKRVGSYFNKTHEIARTRILVKQIVDKIDDKHPKDCKGDSPFKVAEYQNNLEMIKFLEETCGIYDEESKEGIIPGFEKSKKQRLE